MGRYKKPVTVAQREEAVRCARGLVSVIDDDPEVLVALALALRYEGYACETFERATDYLKYLVEDQPRYPGPRCVLCDVNMPETNGLMLQAALNEQEVIPLLLMSGSSTPQQIISGFRAGALHFLLKPIEDDAFFPAIAEALARSRDAQAQGLKMLELSQRKESLTPREWAVIRLVARGYRNKEIAQELGIALRTVKHHKHQAMEKLGVERVVDLVGLLD